ncbi:MAG: dynamin family protein [Actinomycetota bacterium]|nr:dynamin family protein [Actinomycetota bacterium]
MTGTATPASDAGGPAASTADGLIIDLAKVLITLGRTDLATRAQAAAARLRRPSTVVCVVGEFKQGKSSLINSLLGTPVCPVDDDLATSAITLVRFGDQPAAVVRRRDGGDKISEPVPVSRVHEFVSESGNPGNAKGVERVEITVPSALLKQGLVVVDTPGMGGLGAGHAAATLGFLPFADGLIFASDASAELSAPEVEFLRRATELCPTVLFVQTKIDLFPNWEKIMGLNQGHMERAGFHIPMVAVSSALRDEALRRKDRALNELSRVPEVVKHLNDDVVLPAKASAAARSVGDALAIIGQLTAGLQAERAAAADPSAAADAVAALNDAKARLEYLRGPAAKWSVLVGDRVSDMSTAVNFQFRAATRQISRMMDERIEVLKKGDEWDELARYLQTVVADEVTKVFVQLETGRVSVRGEVVELMRDEDLALGQASSGAATFDLTDLWPDKDLDPEMSGKKKALGTSLSTVRGAQGGVMMFGMLSGFLPTAAGVLMMSNPVLLGVGALFGSMGLAEDRKRKVALRRQTARSQVRQFLDDVQFEMGNKISALVRDIQRDLRDEFGDRLAELVRTCTESAQRVQQDGQKSVGERQARVAELDASLKSFTRLQTSLTALLAQQAGGAA